MMMKMNTPNNASSRQQLNDVKPINKLRQQRI